MALLPFLTSCTHVKIVDHEFCGDKGILGASCFHTLATDSRKLDKEAWDNLRFGQICEDSSVFADWKKVIEELCSMHNECDYPTVQAMKLFFSRVDRFNFEAKDAKARLGIKDETSTGSEKEHP